MTVVRAFWRKSMWTLANSARLLRRQSGFKWGFVLVFAFLCEIGLWYIFLDGFRFLERFGGAGTLIVGRLFSLFFLGLGTMLVMSSMVTAYATMFRSDEVPFLMAGPLSVSQVALYKFLESTLLSSWAFFFVVVPFIGAYAWHQRASPLLALWTFWFAMPFLVLCAGLGAVAIIALIRWFPRWRGWRVAIAVAAAAGLLALWVGTRRVYAAGSGGEFALSRLVPGLILASNMLLPSTWMAEGVLSLSRGQTLRGAMLLGMLTASAALGVVAVEWLGELWFYEGWQRAAQGAGRRRRRTAAAAWLERRLRWLAGDVRALWLKDARTFARDPLQWSQALIFFGLLGLYFANIRAFNYELLGRHWRTIMAFLNVFSISAVLCSIAARFVYPQLSLEGQTFWILGLAPTTPRRILLTKFWTALAALLTVSVALALLSTAMLEAERLLRGVSVALTAAMACAVCGLSTGLGAVFLDLRQRNPAAIVSGFGGTLNLVLGLGFMLAAILPFGAVFHVAATTAAPPGFVARGVAAAGAWLLVLTAAATVIPLRLARRSLERRDF